MSKEKNYLEAELYKLASEDSSIFEFLQRGSLDGIWYWDLENRENEWMSPQFWTTLGYDPAKRKHLASEWQSLIHPEDLKVALENFEKHCANSNYPYDQVVRYRHQDGSTVWVRCRGIAIRDEHGKPVRMLGAHTNLTQEKRIEKALRDSEKKYKLLAEHSADVIYKINIENEKFTYLSPSVERVFGYTIDEGLTLSAQDVLTSESYKIHQERLVQSFENEGSEPEIFNLEVIHKNGGTLPVEISASFVFDEQGNPLEILGTARDITKRRKTEEELRRALRKLEELESIINRSPAMVFLWPIQEGWPVEFVSKNVEQVLGYSTEDFIVGKVSWPGITHPEDTPRLEAEVAKYLEEGVEEFDQEYRLIIKSGEVRWMRDQNKVLTDSSGNPSHIQSIILDVTELRKKEEEILTLAYTDPLTGANNRRSFIERSEFEWVRCQRYKHPMSILMIDVDNFKTINDIYGHHMGDLTLQLLTNTCLRLLRENDIFCRIGGEEFAAVLVETDEKDAIKVAERLRKTLSALDVKEGSVSFTFQVSIGVANLKDDDKSLEDIIKKADRALYKAKSLGRDMVVSASEIK